MINRTGIKVPNKYIGAIKEIYQDADGYWGILEKGFYADGMGGYDECHVIHEDTHINFLKQVRQIKKL